LVGQLEHLGHGGGLQVHELLDDLLLFRRVLRGSVLLLQVRQGLVQLSLERVVLLLRRSRLLRLRRALVFVVPPPGDRRDQRERQGYDQDATHDGSSRSWAWALPYCTHSGDGLPVVSVGRRAPAAAPAPGRTARRADRGA